MGDYMGILEKLTALFKKEEVIEEDLLDIEQEIINKQYSDEGLTDEVLEKQVELNIKRNKLNIPDKKNLNSEGWSQ